MQRYTKSKITLLKFSASTYESRGCPKACGTASATGTPEPAPMAEAQARSVGSAAGLKWSSNKHKAKLEKHTNIKKTLNEAANKLRALHEQSNRCP